MDSDCDIEDSSLEEGDDFRSRSIPQVDPAEAEDDRRVIFIPSNAASIITLVSERPNGIGIGSTSISTSTSTSLMTKLRIFGPRLYSFIFDFSFIFFDWFSDLSVGIRYFVRGEITLGGLTWCFPLLSGFICCLRLPGLLRKHKDAYGEFDSKILKTLSKVPSLQPVVFAYHVFKASVIFPTNDPTFIPALADLRKVSNHLNILEGIFEAAPQAILQIYVNYLNYETLKTDLVGLTFTGICVVLSLISIGRVSVSYWQEDNPFIFLEDPNPYKWREKSWLESFYQYWRTLLFYSSLLPYHLEAFFLAVLRVTAIVCGLLFLSEKMTPPIVLTIPEPDLFIPFITLVILLTLPRLFYALIRSIHFRYSSAKLLEAKWDLLGIPTSERNTQKSKHYQKLLKQGIVSIFVYPIHHSQYILCGYANVETLVILYLYVIKSHPEYNYYVILTTLLLYYLFGLLRIFYEKFVLSNPKSRFLLPSQIIGKCLMITQQLDSASTPRFEELKPHILDFTEFYTKRVVDKKFLLPFGCEDQLKNPEEINSIFFNNIDPRSREALSKHHVSKIGESGKEVVFKNFPLCTFVHHTCVQVFLYYSELHRSIASKYGLLENSKRLRNFYMVDFNLTDEERHVLISFEEILKPLSTICVLNHYTSPPFVYFPIQNFTNIQVPLGRSSFRDADRETLKYLSDAIVSSKKLDWRLESFNDFLNLSLQEPLVKGIEISPSLEEQIPFFDSTETESISEHEFPPSTSV